MILQKIDGFILSLYQRFSDLVQDFCGRNCFYLARLSVMLYLGIKILGIFFQYREEPSSLFMNMVLLVIIFLTLVPLFNWMINENEKFCLNNPEFLNPASEHTYKLFGVILFLFDIYSGSISILIHNEIFNRLENYCMCIDGFLFMSIYYFASCTPKPPKKNWVTKTKESIKSFFAPAPSLQSS